MTLVVAGFAMTPVSAHDPIPSKIGTTERRQVRIPVADFGLEDQNGGRFSFASLRGKAVIISFMYTSCPDVCPLITANVKRVQTQLTPMEKSRVYFLSITTDPELDSPAVLKGYAGRHGVDLSNWSFLGGKPGELARVWQNFGVAVERKARGLIDHTTLTAIVDRKGEMRFAYFGSFPDPEAMLRDLRALDEPVERD